MRAARTIWRLVGGAWLALSTACTSRERPVPPDSREHPVPTPVLASARSTVTDAAVDAAASPGAAAVAQALRSVHEQRLAIVAPYSQPARLALGAGRLLQALGDQVVLRDAHSGELITQVPLQGVRALGQGLDGSLFALGLSDGVRFAPHQDAGKSFAHVTFMPGSALLPDLQDPTHFYVHFPDDQQLYRYAFESEGGSVLPIEAEYAFPGCGAALGLLRDGAVVCGSASSLQRQAPRGTKSEFKLPAGVAEPLRLLPAKRLDELYSVSRSGEVTQLRLAAGVPVVARFQLPAPPFAALANGDALAFVLVSAPDPGQPRRWTLLVTGLDGQPRFSSDLPEQSASAAEDWQEALTEDKNLAISNAEPLVAVGGATHVRVWNYAQGRELFAR